MKKIAMTMAAIATAAMAFTAKADDIWLVGTPNDFEEQDEWLLTLDEDDPSLLTGTFYIPAGEFNFCFDLWGWGFYLSPASGQETVVEFTDNEYMDGFEMSGTPICWVYPEWEGGELTIDMAIDPLAGNGTVTFYVADQGSDGGDGEPGDGGAKVDSLKANTIAKGVFNLNGVKVGDSDNVNALPKGVYIINGKKVVNRK